MNCRDIENLVDAHLDGELSGSLRLEFETHRVGCRRCQQVLAVLEACGHVIETASQPAAPDDFGDRVMLAIAARSAHRRWRIRPVAVAAAVLVQAAAVALVALSWPRGGAAVAPPVPVPVVAGATEEQAWEEVRRLVRGFAADPSLTQQARLELLGLAQYVSEMETADALAQQLRVLHNSPLTFLLGLGAQAEVAPPPAPNPEPADDRYSL
jgi:hypothetical protein